uniref:hypothetical protein n=1 Tax=Flavobacterium sp. TaxID=239 RepID=UPI004048978F
MKNYYLIYNKSMTHYKLRITLSACTESDVLALVKKQAGSNPLLFGHESGKLNEKPHFHFYLISDVKPDTLRTQYRKLVPSTGGNKLYSLVKLSFEENEEFAIKYIAYVMKETKWQELNNFPQDQLDLAKQYDEQVKKDIKEKKEKTLSRTKRIFKQFEEDMVTRCLETYQDVIDWVIAFFILEKVSVSVSTISTWVNTLLLQYDIGGHRL